MKRVFALCAMALTLAMALPVQAAAAETVAVCYPTSIPQDGGKDRFECKISEKENQHA